MWGKRKHKRQQLSWNAKLLTEGNRGHFHTGPASREL